VELLDQASARPFVQAYGDGREMLGPLRDLTADAAAARTLEQRMRSTVQQLPAVGITKQAAQQRYGRDALL
jgi:hypothetical protein